MTCGNEVKARMAFPIGQGREHGLFISGLGKPG